MALSPRVRTIVGAPISPAMLAALGDFGEIPPCPGDFDPRGNFEHTYRIWTCHGYRESGNENVGYLKIRRLKGGGADIFRLEVEQRIRHDQGGQDLVKVEMSCRNNALATPVGWDMRNTFFGPEGEERVALAGAESARIILGEHTLVRNGRRLQWPDAKRLSTDWSLFEAVQRRPFRKDAGLDFDLLEGMGLLRKGQRLSYRGVYDSEGRDLGMKLHWFGQVGRGMLPYKYWLDERHRLVAAATLSRAYILDADAEEKLAASLAYQRGRYAGAKERRGA